MAITTIKAARKFTDSLKYAIEANPRPLRSAPLIGGPTSAAIAAIPMPIPIYVPMFRGSLGMEVKDTAIPVVTAPEQKPKKQAKTTNAASVWTSNQQTVRRPLVMVAAKNILKRPSLSARIPVTTRPTNDAALKIAAR